MSEVIERNIMTKDLHYLRQVIVIHRSNRHFARRYFKNGRNHH